MPISSVALTFTRLYSWSRLVASWGYSREISCVVSRPHKSGEKALINRLWPPVSLPSKHICTYLLGTRRRNVGFPSRLATLTPTSSLVAADMPNAVRCAVVVVVAAVVMVVVWTV
jgi:hypothetical protein